MEKTKKLFSQYDAEISEQATEEIENNLREFFKLLLAWSDEKEVENNDD